ncbi:MAG: hypothetical protein AAF206_05535, partial [Bacteroidota bacterium]
EQAELSRNLRMFLLHQHQDNKKVKFPLLLPQLHNLDGAELSRLLKLAAKHHFYLIAATRHPLHLLSFQAVYQIQRDKNRVQGMELLVPKSSAS